MATVPMFGQLTKSAADVTLRQLAVLSLIFCISFVPAVLRTAAEAGIAIRK